METVPCPISGSTDFTHYLQVPDRFDAPGKKHWTLVRSCASGLIMLNPRPDNAEITHHYHSGRYDPHLHAQNSDSFIESAYLSARTLLLRYRASLILKEPVMPLHTSILEIGCSTGDFLNYLHKKKGIPADNLTGVEPDPEAADHARKVFGLKVYPSLQDGYSKEKFDRIVLWHTLEHIHAIHETLHHAAQQLKPDGILVIALPNPASSDAKYYQENWIAWDAPRHLYHFLPGSLEKLLEAHEMSVFKRIPYHPDTVYNHLYSEKLRCKNHNQPFSTLKIGAALMRAAIGTCKNLMWQIQASSLVYFVQKKSPG
ncbi:MAG: class I SAM-dependent methyltransferase [Chlorobiaceae bacterium]|nr:class I SAM-dependent methyltransferase [Chlorobiaceae bacterium]NTV17004.1 class I SAM-dependent methyltransferase [Chlorobiaceae bacterium]